MNICSNSLYRDLSSGSITSPAFPDMYPLRRNCTCALAASGTGTIVLSSAFFLLRFSEPCRDWLSIRSDGETQQKPDTEAGGGSKRRCGYLPHMEPVTGRNIVINFHSDASDQDMGFWMHFAGQVITSISAAADGGGGCSSCCCCCRR